MKKYILRLTHQERKTLGEFVAKVKAATYNLRYAHILLKADANSPNWRDARIAEAFSVHRNTSACSPCTCWRRGTHYVPTPNPPMTPWSG